ncbi:MAG: AAA family ATPase [Verrucomicrobiota bacterium]
METITINQFAGFKEASIETGSITLMIGPQASGKSIVAKLLFFFREIGYELHGSALAGTSVAQFKEESKKKFCRYFPADSWPQKNFLIIYKSNQEQVRVEYNHCEGKTPEDSISITLSTFYEDSLASFSTRWGALASGIPEGDSQKGEQARNQFQEEVFGAMERALGNWSKFQQFFIPAGRAFYSHLEASVFRALETGQDMDPFLVKFGAFVERSKQVLYERRFFKKGTDKNDSMNAFQKMLATVLSADFKRVKGHDYLQYTSDKRRVRLAQASSGQQEALPMLLVLGRFFSLSHISGRSVYIEEPEAHLFPSTQRKIVEFMASTYRMRQDQMCLVITTIRSNHPF